MNGQGEVKAQKLTHGKYIYIAIWKGASLFPLPRGWGVANHTPTSQKYSTTPGRGLNRPLPLRWEEMAVDGRSTDPVQLQYGSRRLPSDRRGEKRKRRAVKAPRLFILFYSPEIYSCFSCTNMSPMSHCSSVQSLSKEAKETSSPFLKLCIVFSEKILSCLSL